MTPVEILLVVVAGVVALTLLVAVAAFILSWLVDRVEAADPDVLDDVIQRSGIYRDYDAFGGPGGFWRR